MRLGTVEMMNEQEMICAVLRIGCWAL